MYRSDADVANLALATVGGRARIASLDEATQEARLCSAFYAPTRDAELRRFPWPFATGRVVLIEPDPDADPPVVGNEHAEAVPSRDVFTLRLPLPSDYLAPRAVLHRTGVVSNRFMVAPALDGSGLTVLLADRDGEFFFTRRVEDPLLWDALFVEVLAYKLAGLIALPLTGDTRHVDRAALLYRQAVTSAWTIAHAEAGPVSDDPAVSWIEARA